MESFTNVSNLYQVAEIELIYKSKVQASQRPKIESSRDAYKVFFAAALKANATGIILAHNHPSGQLVPNDADKYITEDMRKAGELLNIRVLAHLIMTAEGFLSFFDAFFL